MPGIPWALAIERAVGRAHATLLDVINRPLRHILSESGYDPDASPFPGLMGPVFNVRAFGAHPTTEPGFETFDSITAIQAAVDAADVSGGLVWADGHYKCGDSLIMKRVCLSGAGVDNTGHPGTKLVFDAGLSGIICGAPAAGFRIDGLMIDSAAQQTGTIGIEVGDDVTNGIGGGRIRDVVFRNFGTNLRVRGGADNVYISECHFWSALVNHVKIGRPLGGGINTPTGINLTNCFFNDLASGGTADVEYGESSSNRFVGLDIAANNISKPAILLTAGARRITGYGVHIEGHTTGIQCDIQGSAGNSISDSEILGVEFTPFNVTDVPVSVTGIGSMVRMIIRVNVAAPGGVGTNIHASVSSSAHAQISLQSPYDGDMSADRGDASVTLVPGRDSEYQRFATTLTANRTVTLSTGWRGARFRVTRTGLGAFTLDVGGLKTIPSATAAFVDVLHDGTAWRLNGYGTL